jgi:hypothetical protein
MSPWVGTGVAFGHALSVLMIAGLIALAAEYLQAFSHAVLQISGVLSACLLFAIGTLNLARLVVAPAGGAAPSSSSLGHFLPRRLFNIAHPMSAVPIGALFGLGFETASKMSPRRWPERWVMVFWARYSSERHSALGWSSQTRLTDSSCAGCIWLPLRWPSRVIV